MINFILGVLAVILIVWAFVIIEAYKAPTLDENFNVLKPKKTLKDIWDELDPYVALSLLVIFLGLMGYLVYYIYTNL